MHILVLYVHYSRVKHLMLLVTRFTLPWTLVHISQNMEKCPHCLSPQSVDATFNRKHLRTRMRYITCQKEGHPIRSVHILSIFFADFLAVLVGKSNYTTLVVC